MIFQMFDQKKIRQYLNAELDELIEELSDDNQDQRKLESMLDVLSAAMKSDDEELVRAMLPMIKRQVKKMMEKRS